MSDRARRFGAAAALIALTACASGYGSGPPGGREDHVAPQIVKIIPDTNAVNSRPRDMIIEFDGVISERPGGQATTLGDLVLVSPRDGEPNVDWHRDHITIRPRHGWRANTSYTVTLLPGITDLHGNIANKATQITFATGASIPATALTGTVFDWLQGSPLTGAIVEAVARPDSTLVYIGVTDSVGKFSLRGLNPGTYLVRAYTDQVRNHALDPREPFDSTTIALTNSSWTELLTFVHDTVGPQLGNVTVTDSVTLHAIFDTPIDPLKTLDATAFTLTGADSSRITITAAAPMRQDTVRQSGTVRPIDSTGVPGAAAPPKPAPKPAPPAPRPSKPLLYRDVTVTVAKPLQPKATYTLRAAGLRGPLGKTATSSHAFTVPAPPPPDTSAKRQAHPSSAGSPTPAPPQR